MRTRGAAIQGGLAAIGLLAAYATWQREPEKTSAEAIVADVSKGDLSKVRFDDGTKWVELTQRKEADGPAVWIKMSANATAKTPERTGEQIVKTRCAKCHETGDGGAPKIGDQAAGIPRVKQGLDGVVRSAINGHAALPARGGQADLTDSEMRSAVVYMFNKGTAK